MDKIVIDTNVFISALRSKKGASFCLLSLVGTEKFDIALSVPLVLEYESVAKRELMVSGLDSSDIDDILDYLCLAGDKRHIFYLWRPLLSDPKDDMVLELAVESESNWVVTFNKRDFKGCETFGIKLATPKEFLHFTGEG